MAQIYKAYDIRGVYPEDLDEDTIYKIGKAYVDILKDTVGKDTVTLVVGCDMRISSPSLVKNLINGITDQGGNVIDIGLASTPTFYYGVSILNADGGMQVSASHNPKQYNGVKVVRSQAQPVGYDNGIGQIERKVKENDFNPPGKKGTVTHESNVLEKEVEFSLKTCPPDNIGPLRVVADAANAMGALDLEALFSHLPCELIRMNFELDGTFPVHEADPFKAENIKDLQAKIVAEKADLGIATDGDGDRIFFIDEQGKLVDPAIIRGILSKLILAENPGATVCYDIRPGKITRDMIEEHGGKPIVTRVGHTLIKMKGLEEEAIFAGESSGHFFFKDKKIGFFEMPMFAVLKLLDYICTEGKSFSNIVAPLKKYHHSGEINSTVEDKDAKMKQIAERYKDAKISWLDGVTVEYDDFWFNVRPSNTEPLLRLNLEAATAEIMKQKRDEVLRMIRDDHS